VAVAIPNATSSPAEGSATLTDAQAADLAAGKYYVNVHTAANPGGEIRAGPPSNSPSNLSFDGYPKQGADASGARQSFSRA